MTQATVNKRVWTQPGFVVAVVILAFSAVAMNFAIVYLDLWVKKLPAPLVKPLTTVPARVGHWVQVTIDEPIDPDMEEQLATKQYIFRDYVNADKVDKATLAAFEGKSAAERKSLAGQIQQRMPSAVIDMAVTYYTGKADTVAHIPERCYVADGYKPETQDNISLNMGPGRLNQAGNPNVDVRYLSFVDTTAVNRATRRVAYFFFANGSYYSDSLRVRRTLENLKNKHAFYSKVELMMIGPSDAESQAVMSDFLQAVMPQVETCYPDWNTIEGGKPVAAK